MQGHIQKEVYIRTCLSVSSINAYSHLELGLVLG